MREEDDADFDELVDDGEAMAPPQFPTHVAFPMPAWGMTVPWDAQTGEAVQESDEDEPVDEEKTEEETAEDTRQWLREEASQYFTPN